MSKTHWKKLTNPDYLGAYDFGEDEKKRVLTIHNVKQVRIKDQQGREEEVVVATFKENSKPMILNKTNMKAIEKAYKTAYIEEWSGKRISIHVERVKAFGDLVDALRIDYKVPPAPEVKLITLKKGDANWSKVVDFIKKSKADKKFEDVIKSLSTKYKLSPTIKTTLKDEYNGES